MGQEFELKYRATPEQLVRIQNELGPFREIIMETTYYDTPDRALSARKWTFRRRFENGISVCTLKTPGEHGVRGEWEVQCGSILEAPEKLCKLGCPEELMQLTAQGVVMVCGARFSRLACLIETEGCMVELALDRGRLLGGGKELPFSEAEVELKSGQEESAVAFGRMLAETYCLTPEHRSKFKRALALALEK